MTETTYKIHPAIGIMRVGGSQETYMAPELAWISANNGGDYKDNNGNIKKQAQRFRIYEYVGDTAVREVTADRSLDITWHVHLVNKKAALHKRLNGTPAATRNKDIAEADLTIDSAIKDIGMNTGIANAIDFSGQITFQGNNGPITTSVRLGTGYVEDNTGRLIMVPGDGISASPINQAISNFCNNDGWYDDTCDGTIDATITVDGTQYKATGSRVISSVPGYAPGIDNMVTIYDQALNAAVEQGYLPEPTSADFERDIMPILKRTVDLQWVNHDNALGHATGTGGDFMQQGFLIAFRDNKNVDDQGNPTNSAKIRQHVFDRLIPAGSTPTPGDTDMPRLASSWTGPLTLTSLQYKLMSFWKDGKFTFTPLTRAQKFDDAAMTDQPALLDEAALAACTGGPWYPGIESWAIVTWKDTYSAAFRISDSISPGELSWGNAVPWQADFTDCGGGFAIGWWPSQRPNIVARKNADNQIDTGIPWTPSNWRETNMIAEWEKLGFVVEDGNGRFLETERAKTLG